MFLSDTHCKHRKFTPAVIAAKPEVLFHSGDWTRGGTLEEVRAFADWCGMLLTKDYVRHVAVVAGNHEACLDAGHPESSPETVACARKLLADAGVVYLEDSLAMVGDRIVYGSPWVPIPPDAPPWASAFGYRSPEHETEVCARIPLEASVLLTHAPPWGVLDVARDGAHCGSPGLRSRLSVVGEWGSLVVHAFGHVHHSRGLALSCRERQHLAINACVLDEEERGGAEPFVVELA